ncbi:unnamed protein product [Symbiodinium sp. CCMP2592]|nr:unnamed protein product [Symbiodinium sp. CCMP2592]
MGKTCKKPAASAATRRVKDDTVLLKPGTFDGAKFAGALTGPLRRHTPLLWASGCDGVNTIGYCLHLMGIPNVHSYGAEQNPAAATFTLRQPFQPDHLFKDMEMTGMKKSSSGRMKVQLQNKQLSEHNSPLERNGWAFELELRFAASLQTFELAVSAMKRAGPKFAILENVLGCKFTCAGPASEKAETKEKIEEKSETKKKKTTPLAHYMQRLQEAFPEHTWAVAHSTTAAPLPQKRPRVWLLGCHKETGFSPTDWASAASALEQYPFYYDIRTFYAPEDTKQLQTKEADNVVHAHADAEYHSKFAALLQKCFDHGVLDKKSLAVPPRHERASAKWKSLTTSSALFDFSRGQFLPVQAHWRMMGWSSQTDISCLSQSEAMQLIGNGMAVTSTCRILCPLLRHLGYFSIF